MKNNKFTCCTLLSKNKSYPFNLKIVYLSEYQTYKYMNRFKANFGFCASQNMQYYGYKIHAVCSVKGVFESFDLTKASVHDIHYFKDIKNEFKDCVILGDKGYLSADYQLDLFTNCNIKLEIPMRKNQNNFKKKPYIFRKKRKRIETLFSQLSD